MSTLTLLGTGTCQIEHERRASSVLLELDNTLILFDCEHGVVQRLLEAGVQHCQVQHVILSHFHPDHVSDLIPLLHAGAWSRTNPRTCDLHIYGPIGVKQLVEGLMQLFGPSGFQQPSYWVLVHEIAAGPFAIGEHSFESVSLPPAGNHGIRFTWGTKRYALTGDSSFHAQEIAFLKNVDLAIIDSGHIEDAEIVELAVASQAKVIVCSHLYRHINAAHLQAQAVQRGYQGTIIVGRDLMSFMLT
ncbi:MAG: ribonuclease Z [Chloroflexi bacterium]|nr:ribonuclease Z [Chloroflexota bacterium]